MNLVVKCPNGISNFWDGKDFVFVHKNKMYALNKTDDWYSTMVAQLLKQNNCATMEDFINNYQKRYKL